MQALRDKFLYEPLTEVAMALHDAIAFQNRWIDYTANQYKGIRNILTTLLNSQLHNEDVEQAILALENLGFDTLPLGIGLNANIHREEDEK
jgi:hypothetical protein